ncbi:MAG: transposase [Acutalibacteraceae bacterium]|nr:transposase [Acutalibacteraceae bacterium]
MDKEKELPKRKHPRLENYDYSSAGAYFVTICTQNRRCVLSRIVGRGLAPAITSGIEYTLFGKIAEEQLLLLEKRYPCLTVEQYSIMPNHIHAILILANEAAGASPRPTRMNEAAGASPRPTIMDIVCAHKSLTTRECKKSGFDGKLFQTSFYEHIIRGQEDYDEIAKYIYENPMQWYCDELYAEE